MAKRHHGMPHGGKHMGSKGMGKSWYDGVDSRRMQEYMDGEMISEDHSAMANLPQEKVMRFYPKPMGGPSEYLDDGISGIDRQMMGDHSQMRKGMKPSKV